MNIWVDKGRRISYLCVVLLLGIRHVLYVLSNEHMLIFIYWKKICNFFFPHCTIYFTPLLHPKAKSSIEKCIFHVHFRVLIWGDIPRKTFFSCIFICVKILAPVLCTFRSFDYSLDCSLYYFHEYFSSTAFVGKPTYISNPSLLGGMRFVGEKVDFHYIASVNGESQIKYSLPLEIRSISVNI